MDVAPRQAAAAAAAAAVTLWGERRAESSQQVCAVFWGEMQIKYHLHTLSSLCDGLNSGSRFKDFRNFFTQPVEHAVGDPQVKREE